MADVEAFWRRFVAATGIDGPYTAWGFGSSPETRGTPPGETTPFVLERFDLLWDGRG